MKIDKKKHPESKRCVCCGRWVPDKQAPPYDGHKKDCGLVQEWMKGDRCRVGLETIVKLHRQWIDERQPGAVQVLCEIIEIAMTALGRESGGFAEKAMSKNDSIEHWLL